MRRTRVVWVVVLLGSVFLLGSLYASQERDAQWNSGASLATPAGPPAGANAGPQPDIEPSADLDPPAGANAGPQPDIEPSADLDPPADIDPPAGVAKVPTSIFDKVDQTTGQLLSANVAWHSPRRLTVDRPAKLALTLGQGAQIEQAIRQNLPNTRTTSGGTVRVGPRVQVTLIADPAEAVIAPNGALDASTTSNVQLYYQWSVHPKSAGRVLALTAHIVVPLSGTSHVITHDVPLNLAVDDTWSHRADQVFTNWATWSGIGVTVVAVSGWLVRRRRALSPQQPRRSSVQGLRALRRASRGGVVRRPHY
jgi:hypothetical protein